MLKNEIKRLTAFAPATTSNLQVGFDLLGFPVSFMGDEVTLIRRADNQLVIQSIESDEPIPNSAPDNTATIALESMIRSLGLNVGFDVVIKKGIPMSSGLGGSAASAVAAVVALNGFMENPLQKKQLARFALTAESYVSGGEHLDNIAPCLWGSLTLIRDTKACDVIELPMPSLTILLIHPAIHIQTKAARAALSDHVLLNDHIKQSGNLAAFIAACYLKDNVLLKRAMEDVVIEPQRAHLLPGFKTLQQAALDEGAMACSFSGAGPTLFALTDSDEIAKQVGERLKACFASQDMMSDFWYEHIAPCPATVIGD